VNVRQDTTLGDSDVAKKLVQFLIIANGKLKMTRNDTSLLVITGSITSQLEDFGSKVLKNGSEIDRSAGTDTLSIVSLPQKTMNTTDGESETGLRRTALRRLATGSFSTFASGRHLWRKSWVFEKVFEKWRWAKLRVESRRSCELMSVVVRLKNGWTREGEGKGDVGDGVGFIPLN